MLFTTAEAEGEYTVYSVMTFKDDILLYIQNFPYGLALILKCRLSTIVYSLNVVADDGLLPVLYAKLRARAH